MLEQFEKYLIDEDRARRTVNEYVSAVRLFQAWFWFERGQEFEPALVTTLDVRDYREALKGEGLSAATINLRLAALRRFFAWATGAGLVAHNPVEKIRAVRKQASPPKWLARTAQNALLRAAEQAVQLGALRGSEAGATWPVRDRAIVAVMLNAGLRLAEVEKLQVGDVTLAERSGSARVDGKGSKVRVVPLNRDARSALTAWLEVRPDEGDALFVSQKGGAMTGRAIGMVVSGLGRRCELEISPHNLRHSFGKNLADAGVALQVIADLMGHSSIETTRLYTQPGDGDRQAAVEQIAWADL